MSGVKLLFWIALAGVITLLPFQSQAQTNCEEGAGPLRQGEPNGISTQEIIKRFSEHERVFKEAQTHYTYTMEVTVQTLQGEDVDGEFRRLTQISYNQGKKNESVLFAPQSTLTRISLSKQDFDDIDNRSHFVLTPEDLPQYSAHYIGQQKVDQLETYVFEVAPRQMEKGKRYFQGKIWVEAQDLAVVKSCGRNVPDEEPQPRKKKKRNAPSENISPTLVTYREQFEDKYWFPTYIRSDETLHFMYGDSTHVREVIKYTKYKRAESNSNTVSNARPQ